MTCTRQVFKVEHQCICRYVRYTGTGRHWSVYICANKLFAGCAYALVYANFVHQCWGSRWGPRIVVLANGDNAFKGQSSHLKFPVIDLYVPRRQFAQWPPLGPFQQALQVQLVMLVLATGELESARQSSQIESPGIDLYFAAWHC